MSTHPAKKVKVDTLPPCPYGSKCYRKNPAHFKEFSHSDSTSASTTTPHVTRTDSNKTLPVCPFGATCYRKNLLHFAEYSHPFDLLNPDADSSSDEEDNKRKNDEKKMKS